MIKIVMNKRPKQDFGVGVDIEEIARFRALNRRRFRAFLDRVFTKQELDYCYAKKNYAPSLAARFAAKEAVIKALSAFGGHHLNLKDVEIKRRANGAPQTIVRLADKRLIIAISLAHSQDSAIALAVARRV